MEELSRRRRITRLGSKTTRILYMVATTKYRETLDNNIDQKALGNLLEYVGTEEW
jgi:hypothetical protein